MTFLGIETDKIQENETNEEEEIPTFLLIFGAISLLLGILIYEIFQNQFHFNREKKDGRVFCLCCDVWPMSYIRYLKEKK